MEGNATLFSNRTSAGHALGAKLVAQGIRAAVVLGISRGGLPVAAGVAAELQVPLDVLAVDVLGAGLAPEDAVTRPEASAAGEGSAGPVALESAASDRESPPRVMEAAIDLRESTLRRGLPELDVQGKRVAVVDDGVATGATVTAAIHRAWSKGAAEVVAAFPAGPISTCRELGHIVNSVVCLETYPEFRAIGQCYAVYPLITDDDVSRIIRESRAAAAA